MAQDQRVRLAASSYETWSHMAQQMTVRLLRIVPEAAVEHIGSTSVPGLPAKPVVDLAVGVPADEIAEVSRLLVEQGFDLEGTQPQHSWLSYPQRSARQFVVHVLEHQGRQWSRRLLFRDALRADESARDRYLEVKREAAASSANWDEYTQAKTDVVHAILDAAPDRTQAGWAT